MANGDPKVSAEVSSSYGWVVTLCGTGINMALGVLYTWSVISKNIPAEWGWSEAAKSTPYAVACLMFSLMMVPAGRLQDKIGPRWVATIGGILIGSGMMLASLFTTPMGFMLSFGVIAGAGIGFGYASATPPAVKWFPAAKTGMIAGIVVSGFGMASVYAAPLSQSLIKSKGVPTTMLYLGVLFLVVVVVLSQFIKTPPKGYVPAGAAGAKKSAGPAAQDMTPGQMLKTPQFYLMWFMYACGAGAGLMIIGKLATIAKVQAGMDLGFVLVAVLAIGNGGGRILAGTLSDKLGRKNTLLGCFILQAILIGCLTQARTGTFLASLPMLVVLSALIGANYGANLAIFPAITKDFYGLKNFGVNYGFVFTSWGVGGFMLSFLAGKMYDKYKVFTIAYMGAAVLLILAAAAIFLLKPPKRDQAAA